MIGKLEETGVFPPCVQDDVLEKYQLLAEASDATLNLMKGSDPTDAAELLAAAEDDRAAQRGSKLFTYEEMNRRWGTGKWHAVPRFALRQGEKIRPIDNAKKGKHNEATSAPEKLVMCNVAQPVIDARALLEAAEEQDVLHELHGHCLHRG